MRPPIRTARGGDAGIPRAIRGMNPDAPEFEVLIETIRPEKDVDCFHPTNMGNLLTGLQALQPCAPLAIIRLFERYGIDVKGLDALVIGRFAFQERRVDAYPSLEVMSQLCAQLGDSGSTSWVSP